MTDVTYTPPSRPAPKRASRPASSPRLTAKKQRMLVAAAIERLVDLLDEIEPDADEEPSLGWPSDYEFWPQASAEQQHFKGYGNGDDREAQCEDEGAEHDGKEPSLGSLDRAVDQTRWAEGFKGLQDDLELDNADREPSLGSLNSCGQSESQELWAKSNRDDREDEHDGRECDQHSWPNPMAENRVGEVQS